MVKVLLVDISDEIREDFDNYYGDYRHYKHAFCDLAYLEVRDGASEHSPLIDGYCGNNIPLPIYLQSTQQNIYIR